MMVKIASVLIFIQNALLLGVLNFVDEDDLIINLIMYLDLIGFAILAIGFYFLSQEHKLYRDNFLIAAAGIIGWLINRIYWQFSLGLEGFSRDRFILTFSLSSVFLLVSGLSRLNTEYLLFTAVNFVFVMFLSFGQDSGLAILGFYGKLFVVPFFTMYACWSLFNAKFNLLKLPYYGEY